jgi:hypothetical protein
MAHMRRIHLAVLASVLLALVLPAAAPATLSEVGVIGATTPVTVPSCPASPCLAVSRTTGFQVKVGTVRNPMGVPRDGTIVAWTITLGKPNATQIKFFNANEGGPSEAGDRRPAPAAQAEPDLQADRAEPAGQTRSPTSARRPSSRWKRRSRSKRATLIALTVPSWAPALALGFGNDTSWRASRRRSSAPARARRPRTQPSAPTSSTTASTRPRA